MDGRKVCEVLAEAFGPEESLVLSFGEDSRLAEQNDKRSILVSSQAARLEKARSIARFTSMAEADRIKAHEHVRLGIVTQDDITESRNRFEAVPIGRRDLHATFMLASAAGPSDLVDKKTKRRSPIR